MKKITLILSVGFILFSCVPQESPNTGKPKVTTGQITDITTTTATCSGNVTAVGVNNVTARGVCWSTSEDPTTVGSKTEDGTGLGEYTSSITDLTPNTTYYVRAYATNSEGTAYGEQIKFKTSKVQAIPPTVTTGEITNITTTTATCSGNVTADGGAFVTTRGVCWSTSQNPTTSNSKTTDGTGTGTFTCNLTDLAPNTIYYVRAYATNSEGIAYGVQREFFTLSEQGFPTVTTGQITGITTTTAAYSGNVTSDGGSAVTECGICWSTKVNPVVLDFIISFGGEVRAFAGYLTGLTPNTTYYVRAYARNSEGIAYGEQKVFKTDGEFTDSRDGRVYKLVYIGDQVWMAENLAYLPKVVGPTTGSPNIALLYVLGYDGTDVAAAKATAYYKTYGVIYNWSAAMAGKTSSNSIPSGVQGICPDGWHLPSDAEWTQLEDYLITHGYNYDNTTTGNKIAKSLASASGWNDYPVTGTVGNTDYPAYRNKSGFSALPGGTRFQNGTIRLIGSNGRWWSSTEQSSSYTWYRGLDYDSSGMDRNYTNKSVGHSVRCVRD
ncbi:MAG: hypothetical protein GX877_01060 [Bacteroidales bacterium]|nr:hypothetical protein [Bacteroidales bacterium]